MIDWYKVVQNEIPWRSLAPNEKIALVMGRVATDGGEGKGMGVKGGDGGKREGERNEERWCEGWA